MLLGSALAVQPLSAQTAEPRAVKAREAYGFALWLFDQKDYSRVVTELKRAIFYSDDLALTQAAVFMIAVSYQAGHSWDRAIEAYDDYLRAYPQGTHAGNARFRQAESAFRKGDFRATKQYADALLAADPHSRYADDADFLTALAYLMSRQWREAERRFAAFVADNPQSPLRSAAETMVQGAVVLRTAPHKSKLRAGLLSSLVPGLGQVYAGHEGDGLVTFLLTSTMAALTVNRFNRDDDTAGVLLGLITLSFYGGNVYGAVSSVENDAQAADLALLTKQMQAVQQQTGILLGHPEELVVRLQ